MSTSDFSNIIEQDKDKVTVPDLDWLSLSKENYDNIPTENPVEVIPQLQDAWSHNQDKNTHFISNSVVVISEKSASQKEVTAAVNDLIDYAKKQMMMGLSGKNLASKLGSLYPSELIKHAKDELIKLAGEQHLLGNVYVDLTPFNTCKEAAAILGFNKVRLAKYVVGQPKKCTCTNHDDGYCKELKKKVVASMVYTDELLAEYGKHLHIAGVVSDPSTITSKEALQCAFVKTSSKEVAQVKTSTTSIDPKGIKESFAKEVERSSAVNEKEASERRFHEVKPVLAFMQNQMLKGKTGEALKSSIKANFSSHEIAKYAGEIQRVASLQGLMGNVYLDISYYKDAMDAIKAIKTASTNPLYLIQSMKKGGYDDTLMRVAKATGCSELPKDGKIDKSVVSSYLTDLQFGCKIATELVSTLKGRLEAGESPLSIIREGYIASTQYKPAKREGGVKGEVFSGAQKKSSDRDVLQGNVKKALEAGLSIDKIEEKIASVIPTAEAAGMIRNVLSSMEEVDAGCIQKCTTEKYHFNKEASLKIAAKCNDCIFTGQYACTKLGLKFAGQKNLDKAYLNLDEHTAKVQFDENPDESRIDMKQKYDMGDAFGSGSNKALDNLRK